MIQKSASTIRIALLLGCLLLLTGWRLGEPLTFFEEDGAIARAVETLRAKGAFSRVLSIDIRPNEVYVEAQDPDETRHINRWRVVRHNVSSLNWETTGGPEPVQLNLVNPDLEANLFDLKDVDLAAADGLMQEALKRAALEDPGAVTSMEIRRTLFLLPNPSSGEVRWSVYIGSGRENARVLADTKGKVVDLDLSGTNRAKALNILKSLEHVAEAARAFAQTVGTGAVLTKVRVMEKSVSFETNMPAAKMFGSIKQSQAFHWDLDGLSQGTGSLDTSEFFGAPPPFSIADADWAAAGKLVEQARGVLEMADGVLDEIEVEKPKDQPGPPKLEWQIVLKDKSGEEGEARFDAKTGAVLGLLVPESRRKPFDARDPTLWPGFLAKIEETFGAEAPIAELLINENHVTIVAADPQKPDALGEFLLDEEGIKRFGTVSPFAAQNPRFTLAEIRGLTGEQMKKLIDATFARLNLPTIQIINITISKAALDPSPKGNVTVEIRAEEGPFMRSGRVNWEIDGREIKAYLP
jgi:hypothetical protein